MNNTDLLNLIDITVSFEGFLALNKLNLNLKKGELRAVIGPNGAGKTCLLYTSPSPRDGTKSRMPSSA